MGENKSFDNAADLGLFTIKGARMNMTKRNSKTNQNNSFSLIPNYSSGYFNHQNYLRAKRADIFLFLILLVAELKLKTAEQSRGEIKAVDNIQNWVTRPQSITDRNYNFSALDCIKINTSPSFSDGVEGRKKMT